MFSYTSIKDPTEAVTVGEHRARKARDRGNMMTSIESRPTVSSSSESIVSRSSSEWEPLKIVVTRSFGVDIPSESQPGFLSTNPSRSHSISDMMAAEIVPFPTSEEQTPLTLQDSATEQPFRAYETECAYVPEPNAYLEEMLKRDHRARCAHNNFEHTEMMRTVDDDDSLANPFYFPTPSKIKHHDTQNGWVSN